MADEKDEKFDEKAMEKQEEKSVDEKSGDVKWQRDPLNAVTWAIILIYAGVVLLAANLGYLENFLLKRVEIEGIEAFSDAISAWPLVFIGAGVILLIEVAIRLLVPAYRKSITGTLILALIFIGIGLSDLINWSIIFALILIIVGLSIILRGIRRRSDQA